MSRIGRQPVAVPAGVTVSVEAGLVTVSGPRGTLTQRISPDMNVQVEGGRVTVSRPSEMKKHKALHGLTRTLIANMVQGVTDGFQKNLELVGVGYRAQDAGNDRITLSVGFSHQVGVVPLEGVSINVEGNNRISVSGNDKQRVGEVAARIRKIRPPNVYTGKGIKYVDERVRRKAGKSARRGR